MTRDGFFLIASYPKSGNTWIRCLVASLLSGGEPPELNRLLDVCPLGASRRWIEGLIGVDTGEMTSEELVEARIEACRLAARGGGRLFLKTHDVWSARLFAPDFTRGSVYVARDPRDVAVSYARFGGFDVDRVIRRMAIPGTVASRVAREWRPQAEQRMGSWSEHVVSWLDQRDTPCLALRYEDMKADATGAATRLARFLEIDADAALVARAVSACDFRVLRAMEERSGFVEKPPAAERFFREGRAGGWRESLDPAQAERIVADHGDVMRRLGYL